MTNNVSRVSVGTIQDPRNYQVTWGSTTTANFKQGNLVSLLIIRAIGRNGLVVAVNSTVKLVWFADPLE